MKRERTKPQRAIARLFAPFVYYTPKQWQRVQVLFRAHTVWIDLTRKKKPFLNVGQKFVTFLSKLSQNKYNIFL